MSKCIIDSNTSDRNGGGIYYRRSSAINSHLLIINSHADCAGGGIAFSASSGYFDQVTISQNTANAGGAIQSWYDDSAPTFNNSIVWGNYPQTFYVGGGDATLSFFYSDVEDPDFSLAGSIYQNPLLRNDYNLSEDSPCIDSGDPNHALDPDGTIVDMGMYYFNQALSVEEELEISNFRLFNAYPNPFNPITTIGFMVESIQLLSLQIYNINGILIETLVNNNLELGYNEVTWDASNFPSGIYFAKLITNNNIRTQKLMLVK